MHDSLNRHCDEKNKIKIFANFGGDDEVFHGYIVKVDAELVCLWKVIDWHYDGFLILPIKFIKEVRFDEYDKTHNRILAAEGVLDDLECPSWLIYNDFKSFFDKMKEKEVCVSVDSEMPTVLDLAIGLVADVKSDLVIVKGFTANAKWEDELNHIPYSDITSIAFFDEYSSILSKYVT